MQDNVNIHSVHPAPLSAGVVEPPTKFSKRGGGGGGGGLAGSQFLERCCWEREGNLFQERG